LSIFSNFHARSGFPAPPIFRAVCAFPYPLFGRVHGIALNELIKIVRVEKNPTTDLDVLHPAVQDVITQCLIRNAEYLGCLSDT
jgi:hypothetical protein